MIHLNLSDLAGIRRRQKIHAAELADAGLIKKEEDTMDEEMMEKTRKGEKI